MMPGEAQAGVRNSFVALILAGGKGRCHSQQMDPLRVNDVEVLNIVCVQPHRHVALSHPVAARPILAVLLLLISSSGSNFKIQPLRVVAYP